MKLKPFAAVVFAVGFVLAAIGCILPLLLMGQISSGIIGGAGAPTYWRLFFNEWNGLFPCLFLLGSAMAISGLFSLIFSKTVQTAGTVKTSAIALALSAVGAVGLGWVFIWFSIVAFHEMSRYPIEYPCSVGFGLLSLGVFAVLIALYFKERKKAWSVKGLLMDVALSILFLPGFFWCFNVIYSLIG